MQATAKILSANYFKLLNSPKFSPAKILCYTVSIFSRSEFLFLKALNDTILTKLYFKDIVLVINELLHFRALLRKHYLSNQLVMHENIFSTLL